jgi:hypothetical protein
MSKERRSFVVSACLLCAALPALAAPPIVGPAISVGQTQVATAEPLVPVPAHVTPCVVKLYTDQSFDVYAAEGFSYTPPAGCPGPWSEVVFKADYSVTAGIQYDRTASVWIGGVNIYAGTTAEPSPTYSPSWHVERDVTELSAALRTAQPGNAVLYNIYNSTYNGSISGSAELDFYPAQHERAPRLPDQVLSLSSDPAGNFTTVYTDGTPAARSLTLPTNVERAYLDVIAQGQSGDEFWYTCGPDALSSLTGCGGGGFRETEVTIDGQPAGFAPVSPWIFTGGFSDPLLWSPIPGVQTLVFRPFRVDLSPFAALLGNGQPHTIAVGTVTGDPTFVNNSQYFNTAATLLVYQDHGSKQVSGGLIGTPQDSGVHPSDTYTASNSNQTYNVDLTSKHQFSARGYVDTSHGRVIAEVNESASFENKTLLNNTATLSVENNQVSSEVTSTSTLAGEDGVNGSYQSWSFPVNASSQFVTNADGTYTLSTTIDQHHTLFAAGSPAGHGMGFEAQNLDYSDHTADVVNYTSGFAYISNSGQASSQHYFFEDSQGQCYSRTVASASGAVTAVQDGKGCR